MRYMLLVYAEEKAKANWIPAQWDNHMAAYVKFNQDLKRAGKMLGGEAFHPVSRATTVRIEAAGTCRPLVLLPKPRNNWGATT